MKVLNTFQSDMWRLMAAETAWNEADHHQFFLWISQQQAVSQAASVKRFHCRASLHLRLEDLPGLCSVPSADSWPARHLT